MTDTTPGDISYVQKMNNRIGTLSVATNFAVGTKTEGETESHMLARVQLLQSMFIFFVEHGNWPETASGLSVAVSVDPSK